MRFLSWEKLKPVYERLLAPDGAFADDEVAIVVTGRELGAGFVAGGIGVGAGVRAG